ncbi:unnamed protein product, partial [Arabidopsis halleri]
VVLVTNRETLTGVNVCSGSVIGVNEVCKWAGQRNLMGQLFGQR